MVSTRSATATKDVKNEEPKNAKQEKPEDQKKEMDEVYESDSKMNDNDVDEDMAEDEDIAKSEHAEDETSQAAGHKRKKETKDAEPNKAQKTEDSATKSTSASPSQVIKFLLSSEVASLLRPDEEKEELEKNKSLKTYSDLHTPFEELLCAVILSRPISHRLGLRTIRTILNPPYDFHTPEAIKEAGSEKVHQALWDAHTQHKDKTADQIELIAQVVLENDWAGDLEKLREQADSDVKEEREVLQSSIKGLGPTGLSIFYRRVQWEWEEAFPFVDDRTKESLEKLGLPTSAKKLEDIAGKKEAGNDERARRRAFVVVLERAITADLEGKIERVLEEAAKVSEN